MSVVIVYLINECTYVYYHHGYEFDGAPSTYHRRGTFSLHLYIYIYGIGKGSGRLGMV